MMGGGDLRSTEFIFGDENIVELPSGDHCTTLNILKFTGSQT